MITANALVGLSGAVVVAGWLSGQISLARFFEPWPVVRFNAALGMCLVAFGVLALMKQRLALAQVVGAILILLGLLSFAEYPLNLPVSMDTALVHRPEWNTPLTVENKMAPNTAFSLFLFGTIICCASFERVSTRVNQTLLSFTFASALVAICGHLASLRYHFHWGPMYGMHLQVGVNFLLLSAALLAVTGKRAKEKADCSVLSFPLFVTGGATIGVLACIVAITTSSEKSAVRWLAHTDEVLHTLARLENDVISAETNFRGYLVTQSPEFQNYLEGHRTSATDSFHSLESLTADNPLQQARLPELRERLEEDFTFLKSVWSPENADRFAENTRAYLVKAQELRRPLRKLIDRFRAEEVRLRSQRLEETQSLSNQLNATLLSGCLVAVLLFGSALVLALRAERRQVEAEARLRAINEGLERSVLVRTAHLHGVLSNSPVILWAVDRNGVLTTLEGKGLESLGLEPGSLVGTSHLNWIATDEQRAQSRRALAGETFSAESKWNERFFQTYYSPVRNSTGELTGFIAVSTDLTLRREAERLARAEESARDASRLKSEFLANMSHEIRTPMNGILGMTALLLDSHLGGEQREMARVVHNSAEALLSILNDILDFSKIEAGKLSIEAAPFDLRLLVDETLAVLAMRAGEKDLELVCDFDPKLSGGLLGDSGRIRQIITNLVGNAIKFTHIGEVVVYARAPRLTEENVRLRIEVKDTGIGIPAAAQEKLFMPFEQGDAGTTRKFGGTGLGLAISKQLVELMSGAIGFQSVPGAGSLFWFELDLPRTLPLVAESVPPSLVGGRVFLVDDSAASRAVLNRELAAWGFQVDEVDRASAAMDRLAASSSDLYRIIVVDEKMSEVSGLQLLENLRDRPGFASVPVILLGNSNGLLVEAKKFGAAVVNKPVRSSQFRRAIAQVLKAAEPVSPSRPRIKRASTLLKILLADDNYSNRLVGRMILEKMGHQVDVVEDGLQVLEQLQQRKYDVLFTDCQMPGLDGYDAAERIRRGVAGENNRSIPIVALTANAMAEDREKCLAAGMDEYVSKPLRIDEVASVLDKALQR